MTINREVRVYKLFGIVIWKYVNFVTKENDVSFEDDNLVMEELAAWLKERIEA